MAEIISPLTPNSFEPKKAYNWVIEIEGIDAYHAKSTKRPTISFGEIEIPYLNLRRYIAGRFEFEPIPLVLYDPVDADAAQDILDWITLVGDPASGTRFPSAAYKKDFRIKLVDGNGTVLETWQLVGAWPQSTNFGDLDYDSEVAVMIEVNFRIDRAYKVG